MSLASIIHTLFGRAADPRGQAIGETQTEADLTGGRAMIGQLRRELCDHPSRGLTPAALYAILEEAEHGQPRRQHELAADMEEKDPQIQSDLGKRRQAAAELDWTITPPPNPSPAETRATDQAREVMNGLEVEDLVIDLGDGILHGWANLTIPWQTDGALRVVGQPQWAPHAHFQLHPENQDILTLRDGSHTGEALWPLGWVQHRHRAKSGYVARMGLLRVLAWPYLFQNYALGDLAELLEILGIPLRLGKYPTTATATERATLLRALTALGHSAAGIIPQSMQIEILQAAQGSEKPFESMLNWCERSKSKAILGGTLTTGTDQGSGAYALGSVHERGLMSLVASDCRQYTATIRRYLLWPMAALNYGILDLRRAPRLVLDTRDPADLKALAEALPKLVSVGVKIPEQWVHEQSRIPEARPDEPVLSVTTPMAAPSAESLTARQALSATAALSAAPAQPRPGSEITALTRTLEQSTAAARRAMLDQVQAMLTAADSLEEFRATLETAYPRLDATPEVQTLTQAMTVATLGGMVEVDAERQA